MDSQHANDKTIHATALYEKTAFLNVSTPGRIVSAIIGTLLLNKGLYRRRQSLLMNMARLAAGSYLLYRGVSGNCPLSAALGDKGRHTRSINIRKTFVVNQPREVVYYAWRQLEELPAFLQHIKEIKLLDDGRSHWVIEALPGLPRLEWDAALVEDREGRMLSWRSLPGSSVETAGKISLRDFAGNATEVRLMITYRPPAGQLGATLAKLLTPAFEKMVREDIDRFKQYIERYKPEMLI
jgi:uncharacterized membrane protein